MDWCKIDSGNCDRVAGFLRSPLVFLYARLLKTSLEPFIEKPATFCIVLLVSLTCLWLAAECVRSSGDNHSRSHLKQAWYSSSHEPRPDAGGLTNFVQSSLRFMKHAHVGRPTASWGVGPLVCEFLPTTPSRVEDGCKYHGLSFEEKEWEELFTKVADYYCIRQKYS